MAKHFALVLDGVVANVWLNRPDTDTPALVSPINAARIVECNADVRAGWTYAAGVFTQPPARVVNKTAMRLREVLDGSRINSNDDAILLLFRAIEILTQQITQVTTVGQRTAAFTALANRLQTARTNRPD